MRKSPEPVRNALNILVTEPNLAVKGGVARLILLLNLISEGREIDPLRLQREEQVKDLDIIVFHRNTLPKERNLLIEKVAKLKEKLAEIPIPIQNRDFEPMRGSPLEIERILNSRDLTINETVLVPDITRKRWNLYYTKNCWRDILQEIGILTPNGMKLVRYDWGRMLPTNYGFLRLLRFWVEEKTRLIYLPQWWLSIHFREMDRLHREGKLPLGFYLGKYSLILVNQYADVDLELKERWMRVLTALGFTDLYDFEGFAKEQDFLLQIKNETFNFEEEQPFSDIVDKITQERTKRQKARQERKERRNQCKHQFETLICNGCKWSCKIKRCGCGKIIKPAEPHDFLCNWIFKTSNWQKNSASLRRFPKRPRLKSIGHLTTQ